MLQEYEDAKINNRNRYKYQITYKVTTVLAPAIDEVQQDILGKSCSSWVKAPCPVLLSPSWHCSALVPAPTYMAQHTPECRGAVRPCTKHQRSQHMNGHRVTENMNHLLTIVPDQWIIVSKQRLGDIQNKSAWDQSVISCIERWISCQDECLNRCWLSPICNVRHSQQEGSLIHGSVMTYRESLHHS